MEDVGGGEGERGGRQQAGNPLFLGGESAHVSGHVGGPFLVAAVAGEVMLRLCTLMTGCACDSFMPHALTGEARFDPRVIHL